MPDNTDIFQTLFGDEFQSLLTNVQFAITTIAFTVIISVLVYRYLIKKDENDGASALIYTAAIVIGVSGFSFLLRSVDALGIAFFGMVNPSGQNEILVYYKKVDELAAEQLENSDGFWALLFGFGEDGGILSALQAWTFGIVSNINQTLINAADAVQEFLFQSMALIAPLVIALGVLPLFQDKIPKFVMGAVQVALWPFGWAIGTFLARFLIFRSTLTPEYFAGLKVSQIVSDSVALILWTLIYLIATPFVVKAIVGGGSGAIARTLITAAAVSRFVGGPKGQVAGAALQAAGRGVSGSAPSSQGGGASTSLARISGNAVSSNGIIVPSASRTPQARLSGSHRSLSTRGPQIIDV